MTHRLVSREVTSKTLTLPSSPVVKGKAPTCASALDLTLEIDAFIPCEFLLIRVTGTDLHSVGLIS